MVALILEVGCGKHRSAFVDIALDITKESFCDIVADVHRLPFRDGVFSRVVFYEVLEHLVSPLQALREINRVLKKNGELEFSYPNVMHWRAMLRWIVKGKISVDSEHIYC